MSLLSPTVKAEGTGIEPDRNPCLSHDCVETCVNCNSSCAAPALHSGGSNCHSVAATDADLSKQRTTSAVVFVSRERFRTNPIPTDGPGRISSLASESKQQLGIHSKPSSAIERISACWPSLPQHIQTSILLLIDAAEDSATIIAKSDQPSVHSSFAGGHKNDR